MISILAPTKHMQMLPATAGFDQDAQPFRWQMMRTPAEWTISEAAHIHIAAHCGIPGRFYGRLRVQAPHALAALVNAILQLEPTYRRLEIDSDELKAFASPKHGAEVSAVWVEEAKEITPEVFDRLSRRGL